MQTKKADTDQKQLSEHGLGCHFNCPGISLMKQLQIRACEHPLFTFAGIVSGTVVWMLISINFASPGAVFREQLLSQILLLESIFLNTGSVAILLFTWDTFLGKLLPIKSSTNVNKKSQFKWSRVFLLHTASGKVKWQLNLCSKSSSQSQFQIFFVYFCWGCI